MAKFDKMQPRYFRKYGFRAPTIIDVGVQDGTQFLYEAFWDRKFILIDPLPGSAEAVARIWGGHLDYAFHACALGAAAGTLTLEVDPNRPKLASAGRRIAGARPTETVEAPVQTLDALTQDLDGPFGLKIDTEGHELDVIRGARQTLRRCEFVIAEASIKRRFEDGYRFSDLISEMASHGFEVYSFLSGLTRAPRMADILFVPGDSPRFDTILRHVDPTAREGPNP